MRHLEQVLVVQFLFVFDLIFLFVLVAENSEEAREILNDLFLAHDDVNNLEITRHLIIELCVSVFHGLSTPSPSEPSVSPYQRQSKLGTLPLPPSSSVPTPTSLLLTCSRRLTISRAILMTSILTRMTLSAMRRETHQLMIKTNPRSLLIKPLKSSGSRSSVQIFLNIILTNKSPVKIYSMLWRQISPLLFFQKFH
jgi:hypothetical protein